MIEIIFKDMKTVGIIGGMGPETTAEFYLELIAECQKFNKVQRPLIFIYSIPLPFSIEEDALLRGVGEERYLPFLINAAQNLEKSGADFLVMPCNTLHIFIDHIRSAVSIPVLSITEEAVAFLKEKNITDIGILSTEITLKKRIYEDVFIKNNIKQVLPDNHQQQKLGEIIYNVVMNKHGDMDREGVVNMINIFKEKGLKNILLACTDLQLLTPKNLTVNIYDTMKILADATVQEILRD